VRGRLQRADELRRRVDQADEFAGILPISKRLDPAGSRARSNGDERLGPAAYFLDALCILMRGDGAFHQCEVVRPSPHGPAGLREVSNFNRSSYGQQFVFGVQQTQLAPVAGSELEYSDSRFFPALRVHNDPIAARFCGKEKPVRLCR
jgi:hypothetical protein